MMIELRRCREAQLEGGGHVAERGGCGRGVTAIAGGRECKSGKRQQRLQGKRWCSRRVRPAAHRDSAGCFPLLPRMTARSRVDEPAFVHGMDDGCLPGSPGGFSVAADEVRSLIALLPHRAAFTLLGDTHLGDGDGWGWGLGGVFCL